MDQLSMSSARLRNSIITARDRRQDRLEVYLKGGYPTTVFLSLNIPGTEKNRPGVESLFSRALHGFYSAFPDAGNLARSRDLLGHYAFISLNQDPACVKRRCIDMESEDPFARLIDFDIFNESGCQVGRAMLGLPPRSCLVCDLPAVECIRLRRHAAGDVTGRADELLALCRD
jgi:holo-ACP synthase CitX